jgi:hypothetical protein
MQFTFLLQFQRPNNHKPTSVVNYSIGKHFRCKAYSMSVRMCMGMDPFPLHAQTQLYIMDICRFSLKSRSPHM